MAEEIKQLTIERPDGTVVIKHALTEHQAPMTIGKMVVEDGVLKLVCCVDSLIHTTEIQGDLNFTLKIPQVPAPPNL